MVEILHKRMRAVIFAGGVGTRMWPLSRKKSPKQFEPIIEGKSTLQLAVDRLRPEFAWEDIYISTGEVYRDIIKKQLPLIPDENIIGEPEMRDVAPAVGYLMTYLAQTGPDIPTAILWSDHLVQNVEIFKNALQSGAQYLSRDPNRFIFLGQKPRFANQNLGWIEYGENLESGVGFDVKKFISWHYRPSLEKANEYFTSGHHAWNPGYFVVTPRFVLEQFKIHAPSISLILEELNKSIGTPKHKANLNRLYPTMEKISFDDAVVTKTRPEQAVVISVDMGWSDIGTWEALKEAILSNPLDNLTQGKTQTLDCQNNIIYGYTDQMIVGVGIKDLVVVATEDAILVAPQARIPDIKKILAQFEGTDNERYT
jgi:mannose-1-phosphate guanylyltransferase